MAELKTKATRASVTQFINAIKEEDRRKDAKALVAMMTKATKAKPVMWGPAIIGFGDGAYTGASGKSTPWFEVGFSPRKAALSLYLMGGKKPELLDKLGAHSCSVSCLYIKRLDEVHTPTLEKLIAESVKNLRKTSREKKR